MTSQDRLFHYTTTGEKHFAEKKYDLSVRCINSALAEFLEASNIPRDRKFEFLERISSLIEKNILRDATDNLKTKLESVTKHLLGQFPSSPRAHLRRAKALVLIDRDFDEAIRTLKKATISCNFETETDQKFHAFICNQIETLKSEKENYMRKFQKKRDPFDILPEELLLQIFDYLTFEEIIYCFSTSKKWAYHMCRMPILFRTVKLSGLQKSAKSRILHELNAINAKLSPRPSIGTLHIDNERDFLLVNKFRPSGLIIDRCSDKFMTSTEKRPYLKHLQLYGSFYDKSSSHILDLLENHPELSHLKIKGEIHQPVGDYPVHKRVTSDLKSFAFINSVTNSRIQLEDILTACPKLETLIWKSDITQLGPYSLPMKIVEEAGLKAVTIQHCMRPVREVKLSSSLKIFSISNAEVHLENPEKVVLPLKEATFQFMRSSRAVLQINELLLWTNPETLIKLEVSFTFQGFTSPSNPFWRDILPRFTKLEVLVLNGIDMRNIRPIAEANLKSLQVVDLTANIVDRLSLSEFPAIYKQVTGLSESPMIVQLSTD